MKSEKGSALLIVLLTITILLTLGLSILSATIGGAKRTAIREIEIQQTITIQNALNVYMAAIREKIINNDLKTEFGIDLAQLDKPSSSPIDFDIALPALITTPLSDTSNSLLQELQAKYDYSVSDTTPSDIHKDKHFTRVYKVTVKPKSGTNTVERTISQQFILSPTPSFLDFALGVENDDEYLTFNGSPDIIGNIYGKNIKISREAQFKVNNTDYKTGKYVGPYVFGTIYGNKFYLDKAEIKYPDILDNENDIDIKKHLFYGEVYNPEDHYKPEIKPADSYNFISMNFKRTFKQKLMALDNIKYFVGINDKMEDYSQNIIKGTFFKDANNAIHDPSDSVDLFEEKIKDDLYIELLGKQGKLETKDDKGILKKDFDELEKLPDDPYSDADPYDIKLEEIINKMDALNLTFNNEQNELKNNVFSNFIASGNIMENNPLIPFDETNNIFLLENDFYNGVVQGAEYNKGWEKIADYISNSESIKVVFADLVSEGGQITSYANGANKDGKPPTLVLNNGIDLGDDGWLIVFGDLVIKTENPDVKINGNILVTGNLTIQGEEMGAANHVEFDSTIYVYGCKSLSQGSDDNNCGKKEDGSVTKIYNTTIKGIDPNDQLVLIAYNPFLVSRINEFKPIPNQTNNLETRIKNAPTIQAFLYTDKSAILYGVGSLFDIKGGVFAKGGLEINAIRKESFPSGTTNLPSNNIPEYNSFDLLNERTNSRFFVNYDYNVILNQLDALPLVDRLQMIVEKPRFEYN